MSRESKKYNKWKEEKRIRALQRERDELNKMDRKRPSIKLEHAIFAGWKKYYILRDDVAKRNDAKDFRQILDIINVPVFSKRKDFIHRNEHGKLSVLEPGLKKIYNWNKSGLPEKFQKHFFYGDVKEKWSNQWKKAWIFGRDYIFVTKIVPYYYTHYVPVDGDVKTRLKEIDSTFQNNNYWCKLGRLCGESHNKWNDDDPFEEREDMDIRKQLKDIEDDDYDRWYDEM